MKFRVEFQRTESTYIIVEAESKEDARVAAKQYDVDDWGGGDTEDEVTVYAALVNDKVEYAVHQGKIIDIDEVPVPVTAADDAVDGDSPQERAAALRDRAAQLERSARADDFNRARALSQDAAAEESRADYIAGRIHA